MFKTLFSRKSKADVAKKAVGSGIGVIALATTLTAHADGSSSAGGGGSSGGTNSARAADNGYTSGPGSYGGIGSSPGMGANGGGGSYGGSGGSGGSFGSGSTGGLQGFSMSNVSYGDWSTSMTNAGMTVNGNYASGPDGSWSSFSPNGEGGGNYSGSSTPFLSTWNGKNFEFENDFLFGKPETSFDNYAEGLAAYKAGKVGGDSYLLKNQPKSEDGQLKFQIKEIEPEESLIDTFKLVAMDMPKHLYPVTDGNLKETYIFDTTTTKTVDDQTIKVHFAKTNKITDLQNAYEQVGVTKVNGEDTTLEAGDSIVISLPISSENAEDMFLLVDSYFRDWTLGNQVPFSTAERVWLTTVKTVKAVPVLGMALIVGLFGLFSKETNADIPRYSQTGYGGGGGFSQSGYSGGGGFTSYRNRSLVINALIGNEVIYLQTLFPRYVQASQEVIRIPAELINKAVGGVLEVVVTATKKHKVRTAFLFTAKTTDENVTYTDLQLISAVKQSTQTDYGEVLSLKKGEFLHTKPGDVIDVTIQDTPQKDGLTRFYLLKADGFYTKMSKHTKDLLGDKWYARLDSDSKKLLRNLRVYKS